MRLTLPYGLTQPQQSAMASTVLAAVARAGDATTVSLVYPLPTQADAVRPFEIISGPTRSALQRPEHRARLLRVSANYFRSLQVRLLAGRTFQNATGGFEEGAAVVSRSFQTMFLPFGAIGVELELRRFFPDRRFRVVGVVEDTLESAMSGPQPTLYLSRPNNWMYLLMRPYAGQIGTDTVAAAVKQAAGNIAVDQAGFLEDTVALQFARLRVQLTVVCAFAGIGLLLTTIGLYSTLSLNVISRTREFGVRMAVGAERRHIISLIARQLLTIAGAGFSIGVAATWVLWRILRAFVYDVSVNGVMAVAVCGLSILIVCVLAGYLPARRANSTDPAVLLHAE